MFKFVYTFAISVVFVLIQLIVLSRFDIVNEFFFVIGTISVVILFFFKELPLLIISAKKRFSKRLITYLLSGAITAVLYTMFYMNFSEIESNQFKEVFTLSVKLHMVAVIIYYLPIEVYKSIRSRGLTPIEKTV